MSFRVGDLVAYLTLDDKLSSGLTRAGDSMTKFGSSTMVLSGAVAALGGASVIAAMQFDKTMTLLSSMAGVASEDLQDVREHILALGPAVGRGPQELAEAMMAISSTTDDTVTALKILDVAAKASATGMGETKEVGRALTAIINSYGSANISAAEAADILTQTVKDGGAEATELAGVLANVIPAAAQMGVEFEQVGGFLATITKLGTPAAEAVTQLSAIMTALVKPTNEGAEALASIGMSYEDLRKAAGEDLQGALQMVSDKFEGNSTALADVFGRVEAFRGVLGVTGAQAKTYATEVDRMTDSVGALDKAHGIFEASASAKWEKFTASFMTAAVQLGAELVPALMKTLDAMKPLGEGLVSLIKSFGDAPAPVRTVTIAFFGLVAIMGPLAFAVGNVVSALGAVGGMAIKAGSAMVALGNTTTILTARLWLLEAGATGALLALGKATLVVGTFFLAFKGTQWLIESIPLLKDFVLNLGDLWMTLTGVNAALDVYNKHQEKGVDVASTWTAAEKAALEAFKEKQGLLAAVNEITNEVLGTTEKLAEATTKVSTATAAAKIWTDQDIAAKLKATEAAGKLAAASDLVGEKIEDLPTAERILALAEAFGKTADSAQVLAAELDHMDKVTGFAEESIAAMFDAQEKAAVAAAEAAEVQAELAAELEAAKTRVDDETYALLEQEQAIVELTRLWEEFLKGEEDASTFGARLGENLEASFGKALANLPQVIMGAIQGGGDIGQAIGAELGGAAGEAIGTTIGGPLGGQIGKIAGTLIGSTIGETLTDFFGGNKWKETGKLAGEVLGGEVSDELAKQIHDAKFEFGISGENAALLFIEDFVDETGKSAVEVGPQLTALMDAIATGAVPAAAGLEAINGLFEELADAAAEGDEAAKKLTQTLIQQAIAAGQLSESMQAFVEEAVGQMAAGSLKILEGVSLIQGPLGEMGTASAQMFAAGFTAQIAEVGLVQALVDSGTQIEEMFARLTEEGNTSAAAMLAPFVQLSNAINNEADPSVRGFLITLQGMSEVFAGLDQLGFVTQDAFSGLTAGIQGTVDALAATGVVGPSALMAIAPQLAQVIEASERYGFVIDADTQALIDQAKAAGIAFPTDPIQALIKLVEQMVVLMGGTLPEAIGRIAPAADDATSSIDGIAVALDRIPESKSIHFDVTYDSEGPPGESNSFASGSLGFQEFGSGTPAMLHGREEVVTEAQGESLAAMVGEAIQKASGGGGAGPQTLVIPVNIGAYKLDELIMQRVRGNFIRMEKK